MGGVNIFEANGQLGIPQADKDGVVGLVCSAIAVAGKFALGDVLELYSKEDAEALGITEAYDTDNSLGLWHHIRDFYAEAGAGAKLFILPVATSVTMSEMAEESPYARYLIDATKGEIRVLGISKSGPSLEFDGGIDETAVSAIEMAAPLSEESFRNHRPISIIIEGKGYTGNIGDLENLRAAAGPNANRVSVYLGQGDLGGDSANIGLLLGRLAAIPVQRNAGRLKDGPLAIETISLSDGTSIADISSDTLEAITAKGYIVPRAYDTEPGFYFDDDPTCTPITDDYAWIHRGRPMDKVHRLVNARFTKELKDDPDVDEETGYMKPSVIKMLQSKCETDISTNMLKPTAKEISGVTVFIDPAQNILSGADIVTKLRVVPKGMNRGFDIEIGYSNPFKS